MKLKQKTEWCSPHIDLAKRRGIKLTRKNKKKLESAYLSHCYKENGINGLFYGVYSEHIQQLVQQPSYLLQALKKDTMKGPSFTDDMKPRPKVTYNRYINIDKK